MLEVLTSEVGKQDYYYTLTSATVGEKPQNKPHIVPFLYYADFCVITILSTKCSSAKYWEMPEAGEGDYTCKHSKFL